MHWDKAARLRLYAQGGRQGLGSGGRFPRGHRKRRIAAVPCGHPRKALFGCNSYRYDRRQGYGLACPHAFAADDLHRVVFGTSTGTPPSGLTSSLTPRVARPRRLLDLAVLLMLTRDDDTHRLFGRPLSPVPTRWQRSSFCKGRFRFCFSAQTVSEIAAILWPTMAAISMARRGWRTARSSSSYMRACITPPPRGVCWSRAGSARPAGCGLGRTTSCSSRHMLSGSP